MLHFCHVHRKTLHQQQVSLVFTSITETFYALGVEHLLKGRSDYCERPKAAQTLPKFGTSLTYSEMLASQNTPTLLETMPLHNTKKPSVNLELYILYLALSR